MILVRIFKRGRMLEGPKCLFAVLRHLREEKIGDFSPGRVGTSWRSCSEVDGQRGAPIQQAVSCPAVMLLLLINDVKRRPL